MPTESLSEKRSQNVYPLRGQTYLCDQYSGFQSRWHWYFKFTPTSRWGFTPTLGIVPSTLTLLYFKRSPRDIVQHLSNVLDAAVGQNLSGTSSRTLV